MRAFVQGIPIFQFAWSTEVHRDTPATSNSVIYVACCCNRPNDTCKCSNTRTYAQIMCTCLYAEQLLNWNRLHEHAIFVERAKNQTALTISKVAFALT